MKEIVMALMHLIAGGTAGHATRDELLNAETDNDAYDHARTVDQLKTAIAKRGETNEKLRRSIHIAATRTKSFADFERMAIRREETK